MVIDIAFIVIMILAVFKGISKGLIVGVFSLIAFIAGLAAALKLSAVVAKYLETTSHMQGGKWLPVLSFALVFIIVVLLVHIGARIIKKAASLVMLGWADKLGGVLLYMIIYTIIFSVILFFCEKTGLLRADTIGSSFVYGYVSPTGAWVIDHTGRIIPVFRDLFLQLEDFFEKISRQAPSQIVLNKFI